MDRSWPGAGKVRGVAPGRRPGASHAAIYQGREGQVRGHLQGSGMEDASRDGQGSRGGRGGQADGRCRPAGADGANGGALRVRPALGSCFSPTGKVDHRSVSEAR